MDVHKDAIAVAVTNAAGKVVRESILVQFIRGRRGNQVVTFEEGTQAAWPIRPAQASGPPGDGVPSAEARFAEMGQ
jgi:hypothetical protein